MHHNTNQAADCNWYDQKYDTGKVAGEKKLVARNRHRVIKVDRQPVVQIVKENRSEQYRNDNACYCVKEGVGK